MDSARTYLSKSSYTALGFLLIVVVGLLDYVTGPYISFAIFYLLPISLVTWRVGMKMGIALAIAGAVLWFLADIMSGDTYPNAIIPYWNALVRLGFFLIVVFLLSALRTYNERLEATVGKRTAALEAEVAQRARAEELFGKAFHAAPGAMVLTRPSDGYIVDMNESALGLLGYTHEEVVGRTVDELGLVSDPAESGRRRREVNEKGRFRNIELVVRTKSGELRQVLVSADKVDSGEGQLVISEFIDITERKRAEEARQQFVAIVESSEDAIISKTLDGIVTSWNPAAEKIFGYSAQEAIGKPKLLLFPSDRANEEPQILSRISRGETIDHFETVRIRKDGKPIDVSVTISPIKDASCRIVGASKIARDITERKRIEAALQDSNRQLSLIYNHVSDILFYLVVEPGDRFRFLSVNPAFLRTTGLTEDQVVGKLVQEVIPEPARALVLGNYREAIQKNKTVRWEEVSVYPAGKKYGEVSVTPVFDARGVCTHLIGSVHDITERRQTEEDLRASEERFRNLFEEDLTGNYVSTPDGKVVMCNNTFARMFGFPSVEEALECNVADLYASPEKRQEFLGLLCEKKRLEYHEIDLLRRDGTRIYIVENAIGTFNSRGELVEIKGYLFDDTKRRQLEQHLIQAQKMESLGALAGGIAHDFNNILAIMLGHLSVLEIHRTDVARATESIETLRKTVHRGTGLVSQLLTFARKSEGDFRSVGINFLVQDFAKILSATFPKSITFSNQLEDNIPLITGDQTQLYQALLNLAVNARDAMPQGGVLSLKTRAITGTELRARIPNAQAARYVSINVKDTGIGMDEDTKRRIFEPFFTTKEVGKGTGLGLAVVYGVVKSHGGFLEVESASGRGASFTLYFPAAPITMETSPVEEAALAKVSGGKETILLIEDEEMLRNSLSTLLETKGYRVLTATDGDAAILQFRQFKDDIALVLSDVGLPKRNGWRVLQKIREINPQVKAIIASGYIDPAVKFEMIKAGARGLVQKPFVPSELLKKIRVILDDAA